MHSLTSQRSEMGFSSVRCARSGVGTESLLSELHFRKMQGVLILYKFCSGIIEEEAFTPGESYTPLYCCHLSCKMHVECL